MKNKALQKKINSYAALASAMVTPAIVEGQVIYHDFDPDILIVAEDTFALDLNNDGIVDFNLHTFVNAGAFTKAEVYVNSTQTNNAVDASIGPLGYYYPRVLSNGDPIGQSNSWIAPIPYATFVIAYTTGNVYGNWSGTDNGYMAMRFAAGSNIHYGWLRMDVSVDGSTITVKDYAYQATPDEGLNAGEQSVGIGSIPSKLAVSVFEFDRQLTIDLPQTYTKPVVTIMNSLGQKVFQNSIDNAGLTQLDVSFLAIGNYLVAISAAEGIFSKMISLH